jgi:hypothetical protein
MRVFVESVLPCDAEQAWAEVQTSALLQEVTHPLVAIHAAPGQQLPQRWMAGQTVHCCAFLFNLIPLGLRKLVFERVDPLRREIQTRECDQLVRRWDHCIRIQPLGSNRCRYSDEIEIEAGLLTPLVWLFATWFYRHRQRRWQAIALRLRQYSDRPSDSRLATGTAA